MKYVMKHDVGHFAQMSTRIRYSDERTLGNFVKLTREDVGKIYRLAVR